MKKNKDITQPDPSEQVNALIEKVVEYINNNEEEQAKILINEVLEKDPESLDGHILAALFSGYLTDETYHHLKFVMDRDLTHNEPFNLNYTKRGFIKEFLSLLQMKTFRERKDEIKQQEIYDEIIYYSTKVLAANLAIPEIYGFTTVLLESSRFDDVINIGLFLTGDKTAKEIGWPGLESSKNRDDLGEVNAEVMFGFFESKRYVEGARWNHKCLLNKQDDHYLWYMLGETLAWLGYPEETARAWIIAVEKGNFTVDENRTFETLCSLVCDPLYPEKDKLSDQVYGLKDQIPPELSEAYNEIRTAINMSMNDPERPIPERKYIEDKLGVKLQDSEIKRQIRYFRSSRLHVAQVKSADPIVQEMINTIDQYIGKGLVTLNENNLASRKSSKKEKEKVTVGDTPVQDQHAVTLTQFGINVTEQAAKGEVPPIVGRDREIDRMVRILARSEKNNPVLLGEAGVGKTAAVYGLAQRIISNDVPDALRNKTIIELNMGALVAGTTYRGDFEQRMNNIIKEMRESPNIILFIDELHTLIGAGDSKGQLDASNILKPALSSGEIRLIGATTSREYSKSIERDAALERRFSPVYLNEISQQITFSVLKARVPLWQKHHKVEISDDILYTAIHLTEQHIKHRHFPDKAIDLIDEACALARIGAMAEDNGMVTLKPEHVKKICDQWTGATAVRGLLHANYTSNIEKQLQAHVVGHEHLLKELSIIVTDEKLGLYTSKLPRVLYFYGIPDTGKTECAQALSKVLWPGEKERFLYIDMELFDSPSDLNRLMGAPRGTIGSEEGGRLSIHLSRNPYTLVYLYNFHKAHERIIRFFTNLFREGLFSDGAGRTIFVGNAIFILSATLKGNGQKIGYNNGQGTIPSSTSGNNPVPDMLKSLNVPKEIFYFIKGTYFFNELSDTKLRSLIERKINAIKNQPGIRELGIQISENLVDEMVRQYRELPYGSRNLRGMLQKYVYPSISL